MDNVAIKNGVILGVVWIIFNLLVYLIDPLMIGSWQIHFMYIIAVVFMWKSATGEREANEGLLSFGEGFKASLLTLMIGLLLGLLFRHILMTLIDPALPDLIKESALEKMDELREMSFFSDDQVDEMIEAVEEQDMTPSIVGTLGTFLFYLLVPYIPTALLIGAFAKKEESMFA